MKLFIAFNVIAFWVLVLNGLQTYNTPQFTTTMVYGVMWAGSLIIIILIRVLAGKEKEWLQWENDPGMKKASFLMWLLGTTSVFAVAQIIPAVWMRSGAVTALFVPKLLSTGNMDFISIISAVLFNLVIVSISEEMAKLATINAIALKPTSDIARYGAATAAISVWSVAHGYVSFVGPMMWILIAMAVVAGVILFALLKVTGSLLLVALVHGAFNVIQILLPIILAFLQSAFH